jgi:hypothetical protein
MPFHAIGKPGLDEAGADDGSSDLGRHVQDAHRQLHASSQYGGEGHCRVDVAAGNPGRDCHQQGDGQAVSQGDGG